MMGPGMMGMGMMGMGGPWMTGHHGPGCMMGPGAMATFSPEQRQTFLDQTTDLRRQMMEKRFAYMEALRNPKTTPDDLAVLEKEIIDLRAKIFDKMNAVQ